MKTSYIFIRKESSPHSQSKRMVVNMLKSICLSVDESTIEYQYDGDTYVLHYNISHQKMYDLTMLKIQNKNKSMINARVLSDIRLKLNQDDRRKNFYLITAYDDSSQLFCEKLYPLFTYYERIIRDIVYHIVTEQFGPLWLNQTFTTTLIEEIKKYGSIDKLTESALYELSLNQLGNYLFMPFSILDTSNAIDDLFPDEEIKKVNKDELVERIMQYKINASLWERFFDDDSVLTEEIFEQIREKRNIVMHSKLMYYHDYISTKELLENIIKSLRKRFDNGSGSSLGYNFSPELASAFSNLTKQLLASVNFSKITQSLTESLKPTMQIVSKDIAQSLNATRSITAIQAQMAKAAQTAVKPCMGKLIYPGSSDNNKTN